MKNLGFLAAALAVVLTLSACQTAKPAPQASNPPAAPPVAQPAPQPAASPPQPLAPGQSLIQTEASGFSAKAENGKNSIDLALLFANATSVKSWKVVVASDKGAQKTFSGTGSGLPSSLGWDGKNDGGTLAPDGVYTATLSIDYGDAFKAVSVSSKSFVLDSTPPTGRVTVTPSLFSPLEPKDTVSLAIDAGPSLAKIDSWSMDIYDPGGNLFKSFAGKWPNAKAVWDGKGISGGSVVSAEDYPVVVSLRDEFGNVGTLKASVSIDILVIKQAGGYRIANSRVFFKDFTADYHDVAAELYSQNATRLDQLAAKLKKFPGYKIKIVGHAVMVHWDDPALGKVEQDTVLIPLSQARAEAIKQALVERGLDPAMISTEGVGAADPIVPDSDYANRWQNRRTAIFLVK